jgi:hypothetical protein
MDIAPVVERSTLHMRFAHMFPAQSAPMAAQAGAPRFECIKKPTTLTKERRPVS